jgi:hypothetical protein
MRRILRQSWTSEVGVALYVRREDMMTTRILSRE